MKDYAIVVNGRVVCVTRGRSSEKAISKFYGSPYALGHENSHPRAVIVSRRAQRALVRIALAEGREPTVDELRQIREAE